jgi:hypothetical protein
VADFKAEAESRRQRAEGKGDRVLIMEIGWFQSSILPIFHPSIHPKFKKLLK